jgi:hypothetical protein
MKMTNTASSYTMKTAKPAKKTASKTNKNMTAPKAKPAKKMGAMRGY